MHNAILSHSFPQHEKILCNIKIQFSVYVEATVKRTCTCILRIAETELLPLSHTNDAYMPALPIVHEEYIF